MVENDPCKTQRDVGVDVITELRTAGFEDAEEIGRGGFGAVYRCHQVGADRTVAVKVLTEEFDESRERFLREQRAMGRLTGHPNIVGMLEVGTVNGHPYLVMPYHSGGSLQTRIHRDGPLPLSEVLSLGVKIAGALETSHRTGVLHRDIKPGNVLLTDYGEPALTDFGIAHITGGFETTSGTITGSPAFTAPEVLSGEVPSPAADVYGLGATLFCALTGHAAFERRSGEQVVAQFLRITQQPIPDLRDNDIPEDVCVLIEGAMARNPLDRPTAAMLGDQLREVQRRNGLLVDRMPLRGEPGADSLAVATPAATASSGVRNLPLELTSFVGRRTQMVEIENLLAGSRLVTLTGIGGVGKSRLALRVAQKVKNRFTDGVWLVELSDVRDPALLVDVVANALGLRSRGAGPMLDVLTGYLSARNLLVVLDNCEQVIDAVTTLSDSLLRACPRVRILATSREALDVSGESVLAVPPLAVPDPAVTPALRAARDDAVALFTERAAAVVPGFEVTPGNRACVVRICARLDGLPLAIELAAARLRAMSPEQILARLDDRYGLLTRGHRGAPMRQQTLAWCIGWSYDLCTPDEQRLWTRLSVFAGGFELDAAEQVCGSDLTQSELLDSLSALVDKSILIREEADRTVRFRMLETVQEFGRRKAEDGGEYLDSARRHQDWFLRLALRAEVEWIGPHQLEWASRLERELPNLRSALEFAVSEASEAALRMTNALYPFWLMRERLSEGRRWFARALTHTTGTQATDHAKALHAAEAMATLQGDFADATDKLTELRRLADRTTDPVVTALLAHAEGNNLLMMGDADVDHARDLVADAVEIYEAFGELPRQLDALISLGWSCAILGDTSRATGYFEQVLAITESAHETMLRSWALWAAGYTAWREGEPDRAVRLLEEGIRLARRAADPLVAAACTETLAWVTTAQHPDRRAAVLMGAADTLVSVAGSSAFVFPVLLVHREDCERRTREVLGARVFEAGRREGAAMTFDSAVAFALREQSGVSTPAQGPGGTLTKRELQVTELVAQGLSNRAIANRLVIAQRTAEGHVEHILTKLGFTSRLQIANWAAEHGRS
ncbi:protein kinase domain-containing protein [Nocardia sp. NPDC004340]